MHGGSSIKLTGTIIQQQNGSPVVAVIALTGSLVEQERKIEEL